MILFPDQPEKTGFGVCFSGHRPEKLPEGTERGILRSMMQFETETALKDGADVFYSGMARGVDLYAAELVLAYKEQFPGIRLVCACPFPGHERRFPPEDKNRIRRILEAADETVYVSAHYSAGVFARRNCFMVDHSRRLIAVLLDPRSGTAQTVRYAKQKGIDTRLITLPVK
jgi:uncharacterized phage-like protein YoqJ